MRQIYYQRSASVPGLPRKFDEMMQAYQFLKDHSKFLVCFPIGEPPQSVKKIKQSQVSKAVPPRKQRPAGRDTEKAKSKMHLVAGQVTAQLKESIESTGEPWVNSVNEIVQLTECLAIQFKVKIYLRMTSILHGLE